MPCSSISDGLEARVGHADRRPGAVHALADHRRARRSRRRAPARAAGPDRGRLRAAAVPRPGPRTSSSSRTTAAGASSRRWPATTSSTRSSGGGETLRAASCADAVPGPGRYEAGGKAAANGDRRVGVVWHTQGSGKSLTMAFYAGRIIRDPAMENPTLVVLTDRNDLDDQLFGTFSRCQDLLRQKPVQAERSGRAAASCSRSRPAGWSSRRSRSSSRRTRASRAPAALRPAEHRRHRRRGPPQPVRLHRRLRPPHARRPAERLVHRLHRHADRARPTRTRARSSATTSASTTSSGPSRTGRRCRSTTRAGWPSWS